jgi:flap endonuclease-1
VKEGSFEKTLAEKEPDFDPGLVIEFFRDPPVTSEYSLSWHPPDMAGIEEMLCGEYNFSVERVRKALEGIAGKAGQKTLDKWF